MICLSSIARTSIPGWPCRWTGYVLFPEQSQYCLICLTLFHYNFLLFLCQCHKESIPYCCCSFNFPNFPLFPETTCDSHGDRIGEMLIPRHKGVSLNNRTIGPFANLGWKPFKRPVSGFVCQIKNGDMVCPLLGENPSFYLSMHVWLHPFCKRTIQTMQLSWWFLWTHQLNSDFNIGVMIFKSQHLFLNCREGNPAG